MKKILIALFATASVFAGVSAAQADDQTSTANLTVRATLMNGCTINFDDGGNLVDFKSITKLDADKSEQKSFKIECTSDLKNPDGSADNNVYAPTSVALNAGGVPLSTVQKRLLGNVSNSSSPDTLEFQVYKGASGSKTVWGDQPGTDSGSVYATPTQNTTYDYRVVLPMQDIKGKTAGRYENTMIATVNYTASPAGK